jgi:hypothetical protein
MFRSIARQLEGLDFFFEILAETWRLVEIVFSLCFSYGGISFFGGHIFGSNQDIELFFFTDRPSGILVRVRSFIVFHQPLYFLFTREKLHIPFPELEDEYNDTLP